MSETVETSNITVKSKTNVFKVLRNNWKKSTFFFGVLAYGTSYVVDKYKTFQMMTAYCKEAQKYGEETIPGTIKPKHVTVILNPEANYKKSVAEFEKFASPLLHLAGFKISIFKTEEAKQTVDLMKIMSNTDAVLVAGGNGTVQEAVTGFLSRPSADEDKTLPIGVVPLGKRNTLANILFGHKSINNAQLMAEAAMAVIHDSTIKLDVLKIKYEEEDNPIYAVCSYEQGIFPRLEPLVEKYWYLGSLKDKYTYFKKSFKKQPPLGIVSLEYIKPCEGCTACYSYQPEKQKAHESNGRWWQAFIPRKGVTRSENIFDPVKANRINEECGKRFSLPTSYSTFSVLTSDKQTKSTNTENCFLIKTFPENLSMKEFISLGLEHQRSKHSSSSPLLPAREVFIRVDKPTSSEDEAEQKTDETGSKEECFSYIDSEAHARSSCSISLLPKHITVYA